jgi:hypothetical protein
MSITVTRHRGSSRDEDGEFIPGSDAPLEAFAVAPGGGAHLVERGRDGEDIACTVYFTSFVDLTNADELTVDDERYPIIVNKWRPPWPSPLGGLEVLCTRGQG